ncbi:hypothetical protein FHY52_04465 [Nocardia nova]|uniref:hypothetical protein n=1 Tax=Nocardia nova TaxID=37330 RepID=UPI0025AFA8A4|nr:hypothetical protein [Nocardia nova]MDN2495952.1 hypothetical protein [Nocardia nova]
MPYTREVSPLDSWLDEFAEVLLASRHAFFRIVQDYRWRPAPSSPAMVDARQLAQSGRRLEVITEVVSSYLELATHHAGGLAGLYMSREVFAAPDQLARSVIEACAKAVWVLGVDTSTTAKERLARAYLEIDLSNEEKQKAEGWLNGKSSAGYADTRQKFKKGRAEIKAIFPGEVDFDKGTIHRQRRLSPTESVIGFFQIERESGGLALAPRVAEGLYTVLSNGTHPTLYTLRSKRRPVPREDGLYDTLLTVDIAYLKRLTELAVAALYIALATVHDYLGHEFDPDARFADSIDAALPGMLLPQNH